MANTPTIAEDPSRLAETTFAERGVLGAIMLDPDEFWPAASNELEPEHFYYPHAQKVFRAMIQCRAENAPIDFATIHERIKGGSFDEITSYYDLAAPRSFEYQVGVIKAAWARRRAKGMLQQAMDDLGEYDADLIARFKNMSDDIISLIVKDNKIQKLGDGMVELLKHLEQKKIDFVPSGLAPLDQMVGGFFRGHLWTIAGRTSMGKTAMAQNLALSLARRGTAVGYMAIEDDESDVRQRFLSMESGVSFRRMADRSITDADANYIAMASSRIYNLPLYLIRKESRWNRIRARIELLKFSVPDVKVIFIDYLGIIQHDFYRNRWENIAAITREAKSLAGEIGAAIVLLCQINRETEKRKDHKPSMADLRDSGSVEQDSDVIMLLYRKAYYDKSDDPSTLISIAKQRNGPTGVFKLEFDAETLRFH